MYANRKDFYILTLTKTNHKKRSDNLPFFLNEQINRVKNSFFHINNFEEEYFQKKTRETMQIKEMLHVTL